MTIPSFGSGSLLRGALAALVAAVAVGCGGAGGGGGDGGSGAGTNPPNPSGGSGGSDCPNYTIDCVDPCGWFISGYCENGQWKCPNLGGECTYGNGGGGSGGGQGGQGGGGDTPAHPAKWSHGYGENSDYQGGEAVAVGPDGQAVVAFAFGGSIDLGGGKLVNANPDEMYDMDIALAKLDDGGNHVWSKSFGSPDRQRPKDVAVDAAGNIYLAGHFWGELDLGQGPLSGSLFVAKLDPEGNVLWSKGLPGEYEIALALDPAGGTVVALDCAGGADLGGGPLAGQGNGDVCVVALDADGGHVWSRLFGGPEYEWPLDVAVGPGGEIAVAGSFQGTMLLPDPLSSKGGPDAFVVRLSPEGDVLWGRGYGGADEDGAASVVWGPSGPVLTGWFTDLVDFGGGLMGAPGIQEGFVLWLDPDGAHRASQSFLGMISNLSGAEIWDLAVDPSGGVVLAGQFDGQLAIDDWHVPSAGESDVGLVRFSDEGDVVWAYGYGGFYGEYAGAVAVSGAGDVLLTGAFYSDFDLGAGKIDGSGNGDAFVASFPLDSAAP